MESERLRNSLLAALSHDLRTPLTALVGLSETLARELAEDASEGPSSTALAIRDQARRTAHLVDNLLEMAKLEAAKHLAAQGLADASRSSRAARFKRWERRCATGPSTSPRR